MTTNQWQSGISAILSYNKKNESEPPHHTEVDMEVTTTEDKATNKQGNNYGQQNLQQVPRNMFCLEQNQGHKADTCFGKKDLRMLI